MHNTAQSQLQDKGENKLRSDTPANNPLITPPNLREESKIPVDLDGVKDPKARGLQTLRSKEDKANRNQNQSRSRAPSRDVRPSLPIV